MDKKIKERMNMKLAEKIFNQRKKLGMSQEQFAEQIKYTPSIAPLPLASQMPYS